MTGNVWLRVNRVEPDICRAALEVSVADIHEAMGTAAGRAALMIPAMRPLVRSLRIAGPAVTAFCASGDNLMMHRALSLAQPRDVLVVVCEDERSAAQWGDVATTYAAKLGLAGVVIQGCIRDVAAIERLAFPVWFTEIWPIHPEKGGGGLVNAPVICGDVTVNPGDLVVGDGDGVLVVPRLEAAAVVARAVARARAEDELVRAISHGAALWDLSGAAERYAELQFDEYDAPYGDTSS